MADAANIPAGRLARALALVAGALVLAVSLALAHHSLGDHDLPLHDRTGQRILAGDGVPHRNAFSFTAPDHRWVDHEWLFQVLVAAAGGLTGATTLEERVPAWNGLRLILTAVLALVLLAGARPWPRRLPWLAVVALAALALLWTRLTLRPELVSFSFLVLVLLAVERAAHEPAGWRDWLDPRRPAGRALWLTILWAQFHGFYVLAALVWLLAGICAPRSARRATVAVGVATALLAGLLTPSLVQGLLYPARVVAQLGRPGPDLAATISELVPLRETRDSLALTIRIFEISLVWGALWIAATWGRVRRLRVALWLLAAVAAWQGQRNLGLYAVAFFLLHAGFADGPALWWRRRIPGRAVAPGVLRWAATGVAVVAAAVWLAALSSDAFYLREGVSRRWGGGLTPANFPTAQARRLAAARGDLRLANNIDAAATLIHAGAGRVCIDGRTEAYPAAAWQHYATLKAGGEPARRLLASWRADRVVLAHRNSASHALLRTLLDDPRWSLQGADAAGVLFAPAAAGDADGAAVLDRETAAFLAGLPGPGTRRSQRTRAADRCAAWGALLNLAGRDSLAAAVLSRGLELRPDHPALLHNRGNVLLAEGQFAPALALFRRAARQNPRAAGPLVNAGVCLARLGQPGQAVAALEQATRRDPRSFEGWATLAELRRQLGDTAGARRAYAKALALRDDPRLRARARSLGR